MSPPNAWHIKRRDVLLARAAEGTRSLSCLRPEHRKGTQRLGTSRQPVSTTLLGLSLGQGRHGRSPHPSPFVQTPTSTGPAAELGAQSSSPSTRWAQQGPARGHAAERSAVMLLPAPHMDGLMTGAPRGRCSASGCPCSSHCWERLQSTVLNFIFLFKTSRM